MRLATDEARSRLSAHDHATLCTVHPERGVDAVPVVYAHEGDHLGVPIDLVKPKSAARLQRERNLDADPRATLLVEHWDRDDWTQLWWVRAELRWKPESPDLEASLGHELARRYPQYRDQPFSRILLFRIVDVTGWAGSSQ